MYDPSPAFVIPQSSRTRALGKNRRSANQRSEANLTRLVKSGAVAVRTPTQLPGSSLTLDGGSWRAGQNYYSLAVGEILWVVFVTEDLDEGAALLFIRRRLHGSGPEQVSREGAWDAVLGQAGVTCTADCVYGKHPSERPKPIFRLLTQFVGP